MFDQSLSVGTGKFRPLIDPDDDTLLRARGSAYDSHIVVLRTLGEVASHKTELSVERLVSEGRTWEPCLKSFDWSAPKTRRSRGHVVDKLRMIPCRQITSAGHGLHAVFESVDEVEVETLSVFGDFEVETLCLDGFIQKVQVFLGAEDCSGAALCTEKVCDCSTASFRSCDLGVWLPGCIVLRTPAGGYIPSIVRLQCKTAWIDALERKAKTICRLVEECHGVGGFVLRK